MLECLLLRFLRAKAGVKVYGLDGTVKDFADLSETAPDVNGKQETKEQAKVDRLGYSKW